MSTTTTPPTQEVDQGTQLGLSRAPLFLADEFFASRLHHDIRLDSRKPRTRRGGRRDQAVHGTDPVGRLLFNVLAMVAEFEADLIRMRTREGVKLA